MRNRFFRPGLRYSAPIKGNKPSRAIAALGLVRVGRPDVADGPWFRCHRMVDYWRQTLSAMIQAQKSAFWRPLITMTVGRVGPTYACSESDVLVFLRVSSPW